METDFAQRMPAKLQPASAEPFTELCLTLAEINARGGHYEASRQIATVATQAAGATKKPLLIEATKRARRGKSPLSSGRRVTGRRGPNICKPIPTTGQVCFLRASRFVS